MSRAKTLILNFIYPCFFGIFCIFLWDTIIILTHIPKYILPSPWDVLKSLYDYRFDFLSASLNTTLVTLTGLIFSVFFGVLFAVIVFSFRLVEKTMSPYIVILQTTPIISIIPLLIIWFKNDLFLTLVICACISSIFPIITSVLAGFKSTDPSLIKIFRIYGATRLQTLFKLHFPSMLPFFLNGLKISSALALIGGVSGEFIAGTGGRGFGLAYMLLMAGYNLQTDKLFAALFVIVLLGVGLHLIFGLFLENYKWGIKDV